MPGPALQAAWRDLLAAAGDAGYAVGELVRAPATPEQTAAAEREIGRCLPDDLADLYLLSDGQVDWLRLVEGEWRISRLIGGFDNPLSTTDQPGTWGVGHAGVVLDLVYNVVVLQHLGNIEVDSEPGRTVLHVRLPLRQAGGADTRV